MRGNYLVTDAAFVGLFAAVGQLVVLVVPFLVEALAAELAREGLEACVDTRMRVQSRAAVECFAASVTSVRLLLRVYDLVPRE